MVASDVLQDLVHRQRFGLQHPAALPREAENGVDQPVHPLARGTDEFDCFGQVLAHRDIGFGAHQRVVLPRQIVEEARQPFLGRLQLGGEAHDVDQRRAEVVTDDIGEALDLFVGALEIGRARGDRAFEPEIEPLQVRTAGVEQFDVPPQQPDRAQCGKDQRNGDDDQQVLHLAQAAPLVRQPGVEQCLFGRAQLIGQRPNPQQRLPAAGEQFPRDFQLAFAN